MKISHIEHLGIAVQSIEESLPFFTDVLGLECYATELIDEKPRKGAEQLNIAFLHPKSTAGVLTELCEH